MLNYYFLFVYDHFKGFNPLKIIILFFELLNGKIFLFVLMLVI